MPKISYQVSVYHQRKMVNQNVIFFSSLCIIKERLRQTYSPEVTIQKATIRRKFKSLKLLQKTKQIKKVKIHITHLPNRLSKIKWIFISIMAEPNTLLVLSYGQRTLHNRLPKTSKKIFEINLLSRCMNHIGFLKG